MAVEEEARKHAVLSARVPVQVRELVRAAASAKGRTISSYVASKIQREALEDLNDTYGGKSDRVRATA